MKVKIRIIKTDDIMIEDEVEHDTLDLSYYQSVVGGYIEPVYINEDEVMLVNDEGLINGMPFNRQATLLAQIPIMGNVIVIPKECFE